MTEPEPSTRLKRGRPSKVACFRDFVSSQLAEDPDLSTKALYGEAVNRGLAGSKSAFYELVAQVRHALCSSPTGSLAVPGRFTRHVCIEAWCRFTRIGWRQVAFVVSRLEHSGAVVASTLATHSREGFFRTYVDHLRELGGAPLTSVFESPRHVAESWTRSGRVVEWNATFAQLALQLGVGVSVLHAGARTHLDQRLTEMLMSEFLRQPDFADRVELGMRLRAWTDAKNGQLCPDGRPSRIAQLAEQRELRRLVFREGEDVPLLVKTVVDSSGRIRLDGEEFMLSQELHGRVLNAVLYANRVDVQLPVGRMLIKRGG